MPRPLRILTGQRGGAELVDQGFAIVGYVFDAATGSWTWIGEQ
jgi:hypothetical protein